MIFLVLYSRYSFGCALTLIIMGNIRWRWWAASGVVDSGQPLSVAARW